MAAARRTLLLLALCVSAGCGSSGGGPSVPTVGKAAIYRIAGFTPGGALPVGKPVTVSFWIEQPNGQPLTRYRTGAGPHTGMHVIVVRDDLSSIIHVHPPIGPDGKVQESLTFPEPGHYRLLADVYPQQTGSGPLNFQLFRSLVVGSGKGPQQPLPAFSPTVTVGGDRFRIVKMPKLRALRPATLTVDVTDAHGRRAHFTPWFGALAHAIFFHAGNLAYFHTHVCAPGSAACTSGLGGASISRESTTPGVLHVGVLLPQPGTWRLFLQARVDGTVVSAPFTLKTG